LAPSAIAASNSLIKEADDSTVAHPGVVHGSVGARQGCTKDTVEKQNALIVQKELTPPPPPIVDFVNMDGKDHAGSTIKCINVEKGYNIRDAKVLCTKDNSCAGFNHYWNSDGSGEICLRKKIGHKAGSRTYRVNSYVKKSIHSKSIDDGGFQKPCYKDSGSTYKGKVNVTKSGYKCQNWMKDSPHGHGFNAWYHYLTRKTYDIGNHNYCRNPDGEPGPWCYTTNKSKRWEVCDMKKC